MIKTQVSIPNDLFRQAKRVSAERGCSFAEVVRRGLEYMTQASPPDRKAGTAWRVPPPLRLGVFLTPDSRWTELSHED